MTAEPRRVVVLGGTFDPVHNGHLAIAAAVPAALDAAECWMVPARAPNLRDAPAASPTDRRDMLTAATRGLPGVRVVDNELHREGGSYTIDTLDELSAAFPGAELWWVLGADAVRHVREWHRSDDLLRRGHFVVVQRAGTPPVDAAELGILGLDPGRTRVLAFTPPPVSAGLIRSLVAAGRSIADLVPPTVATVIAERALYRS